MRLAVVLALVCLTQALPYEKHVKIADKVHLRKQRDVFRLLNYINQPSYYKDIEEIASSFTFEDNFEKWTKPEFAKDFWRYYKHGMLPRGEIFSVFYPRHLKEAIALFRVFFYAKDYETFYKAAAWARNNVNEGMFVYALSVSVVHSKLTREVVLPPIYETHPHYFFNDEVIKKAQQLKQHYWEDDKKEVYTIPANYSGWYMNVHPEQSIAYFTEDVGVNADYHYHNIYAPFWMTNEETFYKGAYRGEYFFWFHQQFLARYYLERLSNDMGEIPTFEYEHPIETGFYPSITYPNGIPFPSRPNHADLYQHSLHGKQSDAWNNNYTHSYMHVKDYERRLRDALSEGVVHTEDGRRIKIYEKDGLEILGNLVESNVESKNAYFYGDLLIFARHLLGYSYNPLNQHKLVPSALEHFETSLRDPMFWQLYKRIMFYFYQYQNHMGPYKLSEMFFDGVRITDIQSDQLITFFDYNYADISNAVAVNEAEFLNDTFNVRAKQLRLNYKPFDYTIRLTSEEPAEAFIKLFIGPKYDEYGREFTLEENRKNFFEIDRFHHKLTAGENAITRNSHNFIHFARQRTTWRKLEEINDNALNDIGEFKIFDDLTYYGFPKRMILPKGKPGGMTFQFYAIAVPYHAPPNVGDAANYLVDMEYSIGYPFDRPIKLEWDFTMPNTFFKDIIIKHKKLSDDINPRWSKY